MAKITLMLFTALLLSACAHDPSIFDPAACPRERVYTKAEQKALAAAMAKTPTVIQGAITDYGKLRDQARACRGKR